MLKFVPRRAWQFAIAFLVGVLALMGFRSLVVAAASALLAGVSAQAVAAATGKAAGATAPVHATAAAGAFVGSLMLLLNLKGRPWQEKMILLSVSGFGSYSGGVAAAEAWQVGPGAVGFAGMVCGVMLIPLIDAVLAVLKDIPWIKRLVFRRVTGEQDSCAVHEDGSRPSQ